MRLRANVSTVALVALVTARTFAPAGAFATEQPYGWTISASSVDPFENTTAPTFGVDTFYLWLVCCNVPDHPDGTPRIQGMAAAEFALDATGIVPLAFQPPCLITDLPPLPDVVIACGCTCGPVIAGSLLVLNLPGSICYAPSSNGVLGAVDCESSPQLWGMDWIGIDTTGAGAPCSDGAVCEKPVPIEDLSWGRLKAMYR